MIVWRLIKKEVIALFDSDQSKQDPFETVALRSVWRLCDSPDKVVLNIEINTLKLITCSSFKPPYKRAARALSIYLKINAKINPAPPKQPHK